MPEDAIAGQRHIAFEHNGYDYKNPADVESDSDVDPLIPALVGTAAFNRLSKIRFLGAIDYQLVSSPNGRPLATRFTRHQHTMGVLRLARHYCRHRHVGPTDSRLICAAALLHDIGHPPLSHSMEPLFREDFGIDHHMAAEQIVTGRVGIGRDVFSTLREFRVDIDELLQLISGKDERFDGFFSGPINFDTIEGVLRTYSYVQRSVTMSPDTVVQAAILRDDEKERQIVDEFWNVKQLIYAEIINSTRGLLADFVCRKYMKQKLGSLSIDCFYEDDNKVFNRLPGLNGLLRNRHIQSSVVPFADEPVSYWQRRYYVDERADFFAWNDHERYRCSRYLESMDVDSIPGDIESAVIDEGEQLWLF